MTLPAIDVIIYLNWSVLAAAMLRLRRPPASSIASGSVVVYVRLGACALWNYVHLYTLLGINHLRFFD